jgi:predicted nuclease of predicted toxin-antitoxin system
LSLRLLIDEDTQAKLFVTLLKQAGHDVIIVNEVNLMGQKDSVILNFARQNNRLLITQNCDDYEALHQTNPIHPGILAVYNNTNPSKNMSFSAMVKAISNLEAASIPLANQFISLNHWNY